MLFQGLCAVAAYAVYLVGTSGRYIANLQETQSPSIKPEQTSYSAFSEHIIQHMSNKTVHNFRSVITTDSSNTADSEVQTTSTASYRSVSAWLLLNFAIGPTFTTTTSYIPASLQTIGMAIGHTPTGDKCRPAIMCLVPLGRFQVDVNSYVLYLSAIAYGMEAFFILCISGIADYSNHRKVLLIASVLIFGLLALPLAGLTGLTNSDSVALSVLYILSRLISNCTLTFLNAYLPFFMRGSSAIKTGKKVSVHGNVVADVASILALVVGMIITGARGTAGGRNDFLIACTVAGCVAIISALVAAPYLPLATGKPRPKGNIILLSFRRFYELLCSIQNYRQTFLFLIWWTIWNASYAAFLQVLGLLFRSDLHQTNLELSIYAILIPLCSVIGNYIWLAFARQNLKRYAIILTFLSMLSVVWGIVGISSQVGYHTKAEIWVFAVWYSLTTGPIRSINRVIYSMLLPKDNEVQYFGLEIVAGVAVGWIAPLVNGVIQDHTHNLRWPFAFIFIVMLLALGILSRVDLAKGRADVGREEDA